MITDYLFLGCHLKVSEGEKERSINGSSELASRAKTEAVGSLRAESMPQFQLSF